MIKIKNKQSLNDSALYIADIDNIDVCKCYKHDNNWICINPEKKVKKFNSFKELLMYEKRRYKIDGNVYYISYINARKLYPKKIILDIKSNKEFKT